MRTHLCFFFFFYMAAHSHRIILTVLVLGILPGKDVLKSRTAIEDNMAAFQCTCFDVCGEAV